MNPEQQANYWKFHERKKENILRNYEGITPEQAKEYKKAADEARLAQLQPSERALEDARNQATAQARAEAEAAHAAEMAEVVLERFVEDPQQRQAVLSGLNPASFMTNGKFDKDKLVGHMTGLSAAFGGQAGAGDQPRQWGQAGHRPPPQSARDYALAEAQRRGHIKKQ
jgi:hypothetical protein